MAVNDDSHHFPDFTKIFGMKIWRLLLFINFHPKTKRGISPVNYTVPSKLQIKLQFLSRVTQSVPIIRTNRLQYLGRQSACILKIIKKCMIIEQILSCYKWCI